VCLCRYRHMHTSLSTQAHMCTHINIRANTASSKATRLFLWSNKSYDNQNTCVSAHTPATPTWCARAYVCVCMCICACHSEKESVFMCVCVWLMCMHYIHSYLQMQYGGLNVKRTLSIFKAHAGRSFRR